MLDLLLDQQLTFGEPFRDPEFRWVGAVLSAFGICYNTDVLDRLGFEGGLTRWEQLTDPRLFGQVVFRHRVLGR